MRCSIIRRVSTEKQAAERKNSLKEQLSECQKAIEQRNWAFVRDFNFGNCHGHEVLTHPLYAELKQHIADNKCDVIVTKVIDLIA
jgi:DNA invertase Pin-like site-specific DNA recombinase